MPREITIGVALYTGQRPAGSRGPLYQDAAELARAAEQAGFDCFWVSEHHGWADGYLPAPLVLAAAVASATTRIQVGTGLALAPLHHPVALAEAAAVVDHLSGGRLILGLGVGYVRAEYRALGGDWRMRGQALEETIAILRRAGTGESFEHHGRAFDLERVRVTPAAVRPTGIPIWLGGYAPAAVDRAARIADGHLVGRAEPALVASAGARLAAIRSPADPTFTFAANVVAVLDHPGGAAGSALAGYSRQQAAYEEVQRTDDAYSGRVAAVRERGGDLNLGSIDNYLQARGGPDDLVPAIAALLAPAGSWSRLHVALRIIFPEADVKAVRGRLEAFGELVLPRLRAALAQRRK